MISNAERVLPSGATPTVSTCRISPEPKKRYGYLGVHEVRACQLEDENAPAQAAWSRISRSKHMLAEPSAKELIGGGVALACASSRWRWVVSMGVVSVAGRARPVALRRAGQDSAQSSSRRVERHPFPRSSRLRARSGS